MGQAGRQAGHIQTDRQKDRQTHRWIGRLLGVNQICLVPQGAEHSGAQTDRQTETETERDMVRASVSGAGMHVCVRGSMQAAAASSSLSCSWTCPHHQTNPHSLGVCVCLNVWMGVSVGVSKRICVPSATVCICRSDTGWSIAWSQVFDIARKSATRS